jgi:hypothetical protein
VTNQHVEHAGNKQGKCASLAYMKKQNINILIESTPCNMQEKYVDRISIRNNNDVIEKMTHSLKRASKIWNIILNSISNHLNGKTKSRNMRPRGVLT